MSLAHILKPIPPVDFLARNWAQRAVHIPGQRGKFQDLFSWDIFNELLNNGALQPPKIELVHSGKGIDASQFMSPAPSGLAEATVDPLKVIGLCQTVRKLARELRGTLGEHTQVNAYCSWAGVQGFNLHYDTHEVIVLQVEGKKRWRVFEPTVNAPLTFLPGERLPEGAKPYIEQVLSKGDVLYVPRGHWHDAIAESEPSIHLAVGILCRTGLSFHKWIGERLKDQDLWTANLPSVLGSDGDWRHNESAINQHLNRLADHLRQLLQDAGTIRAFAGDCVSSDSSAVLYQLPQQVLADQIVTLDTRFTRPASQQHLEKMLASDRGFEVTVYGRKITVRGALIPPLREIFSRRAVTGAELMQAAPTLAWDDLRPLLVQLVRAGVLLVDASKPSAAA
jgi:ribosomal protein L16 Arg81 hydroxylase